MFFRNIFIRFFLLIILCLSLVYFIQKKETSVYDTLSNIYEPTFEDYKKIEAYMQRKGRKELNLMKVAIKKGGNIQDYKTKVKKLRLVSDHQPIQKKLLIFGTHDKDKKRCVVSYASFNQNFPKGIHLLQESLEKVGYQGHFSYQIGGWPDLEGGSIRLAHVPYAFKSCYLQELKKKGYKLILWMDSSIRALKDLDPIFKTIEEQGYLFYPAGHTLEQYCSHEAITSMDLTDKDAEKISSVLAGLFGINLDHPIGAKIAEEWHEAAKKESPFYSPRADQTALSMILYKMGITSFEPSNQYGWLEEHKAYEPVFFIDHKSIQ